MSVDSHISKRMESVISMVTRGARICDVGCDHAYVSIALVERGISPFALAMDVNSGPLERAGEHIETAGLSGQIVTRLSDGLKAYNIGETDTLIIAGMGGPLMRDILSYSFEKTNDFNEMILSPQSEIPDFRAFLIDNGYTIVEENMVYEDDKYYVVMKAVQGQESIPYSDVELAYGRISLSKSKDVLKSFLEKERKKIDTILCKLNKQTQTDEIIKRVVALRGESERLGKAWSNLLKEEVY